VVVLFNLLLLGRFGAVLSFTLFHIGLERCNLLVDTRNVLFDDESKLLTVVFGDSRKK
jgi:hypothetical protein